MPGTGTGAQPFLVAIALPARAFQDTSGDSFKTDATPWRGRIQA